MADRSEGGQEERLVKGNIVRTVNHGLMRYQLNLGKRLTGENRYRRKYFKTKKEARKYLDEIVKRQSAASCVFSDLGPAVGAALLELYRIMVVKEMSIETARDILERIEPFAAEGAEESPPGLKLEQAVEKFLKFQKAQNLDPNYSSLDRYWEVRKGCYRRAGIESMPPNVFRKSFASYDWSLDRDTNRLCAHLGNSPGIVLRHYVAPVDDSMAKEFKRTVPSNRGAEPESSESK